MPDIYIGTTVLGSIQLGTTPVEAVYQGTTPIWSNASGWTPLDMFAASEVGAYYEIGTGMTTLGFHRCYQDTARTMPCTTAGQNIRSISDLSGNARHLSMASSPYPTLESDAKGYYMQTNAAGGAMATLAIDDVVSSTMGIAMCIGYGATVSAGAGNVLQVSGVGTNCMQVGSVASTQSAGFMRALKGGVGIDDSITVASDSLDRTQMLHSTYTTPNTYFAAFRNGNATPIATGGASGQMPNMTSIAVGRTAYKWRSALYYANTFLDTGLWAQLNTYWKNVFTGSNAI